VSQSPLSQSQSQNHIATDGQSVSQPNLVSSPIWGSRPDIYYTLTIMVLFLWGTHSEERTGLSLYMLLALARAVFLGSEPVGTRDHILLSQIWDFLLRRLLRLAGSPWRYSTPPAHKLYVHTYSIYSPTEGMRLAIPARSEVPKLLMFPASRLS
jgi:hypothetical protein